MDWSKIEKAWSVLVPQAREKWPALTDSDIQTIGGDKARLIARLKERYEWSDAMAEEQIQDWSSTVEIAADQLPLMEELERLKDELGNLADTVKSTLRNNGATTPETASKLIGDVEQYIEKNPMQAMMLAAGVGLAIGWLTKPKK
ncbi:MAG: hypothetical protein AB7S74_10990 [Hyphomicrobium sp.]